MELIFLILTIIALVATVVFGFLQVIVPFIKGEVRLSKRFPFVEGGDVAGTKKRKRRKKKSTKRYLIPIFAVAVLVVAFVLVKSLMFQTTVKRVPIAVMTFKNRSGDRNLDYLCEAIPNLLITNLEQSKYLSVMTWERMHDLLKVLGEEDLGSINEDVGFELCELDGINAIVMGSFTRADGMFVTEVKVLDVRTKKLLKSASSQGDGVASILRIQIDELSGDIAKSVSLYERVTTPTEMKVMDVTTTSMEAYNYFLRGREDYEKWYYEDARRFLEKAIEIDSTFASAYLYLSWVYDWLNDYKKSNGALKKAKAFSDKVTEKEKLYIEATYATVIEDDSEKSLRIREQLTAKYPREKRVHVNLARYYEKKGLNHRAIEEYNKALELDPNYGVALYKIAYRYADIGDYAKAIEYFKQYAAVSPGDANPFDSMGDLYFQMGQLDEALAQYKEALFVKPDFYISNGRIAYICALHEEYAEAMQWLDHLVTTGPSAGTQAGGLCQKAFYSHLLGNTEQAVRSLNTAENLLEPTEFDFGMALVDWIWTWIYCEQGKLERSRRHLTDCYANLYDIPYNRVFFNFYKGSIELKQQTFDSVKARIATIESLLPNMTQAYRDHAQFLHALLYAEMLLAQDSLEKSITIFEEPSKFEVNIAPAAVFMAIHIPYDKDVIARAYLKKGDVGRAISEYEKLIDSDPNNRGRSLIRPRWRYKLAKLYEEQGFRAKAIEQYEKFLDIWKDADADRPELLDARKCLVKLKAG